MERAEESLGGAPDAAPTEKCPGRNAMPDSSRTGRFDIRALDFATVDSRPPAASAALAATPPATPSRLPATKALLLIDNVTLTRECLTYLLAAELKDFEIISVVHPQQAAEYGISPDVVLLNTRASQRFDGTLLGDIALTASATHPAPVLLLSDGEDAAEAADCGLAGQLPSSCGVPLLIAAINLVVAGGQFRASRSAPGHNEGNRVKR